MSTQNPRGSVSDFLLEVLVSKERLQPILNKLLMTYHAHILGVIYGEQNRIFLILADSSEIHRDMVIDRLKRDDITVISNEIDLLE